MKNFKNDKGIKDANDFEEYASEAFDEFLDEERFQDRIAKLGGLHFPGEIFDISSMRYQEF